jgi:hypothetical protein
MDISSILNACNLCFPVYQKILEWYWLPRAMQCQQHLVARSILLQTLEPLPLHNLYIDSSQVESLMRMYSSTRSPNTQYASILIANVHFW